MTRACFVSDLHLFANRSHGHDHLDRIIAAAGKADHFVLGGDIFDFKWSTLSDTESTIDAAIHWLRDLCRHVPDTQVQFLLGNHDYHLELIDRLPSVADEVHNFDWNRFFIRLGDAVFLHGDVADRRMTAQMLEQRRAKWTNHRPPSRYQSRAYDLVVKTRVHMLVPRAVYPRRTVARRILSYLEDINQGPGSGVRQVCFGHTHLPVTDYHYGGLCFHNGGAPIGKQATFRILELDINHNAPPAP